MNWKGEEKSNKKVGGFSKTPSDGKTIGGGDLKKNTEPAEKKQHQEDGAPTGQRERMVKIKRDPKALRKWLFRGGKAKKNQSASFG